jgi:hypothetical protein
MSVTAKVQPAKLQFDGHQLLQAAADGLVSWREAKVFGAVRHIYRLHDGAVGDIVVTEQVHKLLEPEWTQRDTGGLDRVVAGTVVLTVAGKIKLRQLEQGLTPPEQDDDSETASPVVLANGADPGDLGRDLTERQLLGATADGNISWEISTAIQVERSNTYRLRINGDGDYQVVTRQVQRLLDADLAECDTSEGFSQGRVKLTIAGRTQLVRWEEQEDGW